ncbi:MAG: hypothetical protein COA84_01140 [Robiginitomaculum sp.]|nr:MAG: hypothetical protein COA84_01140 [Robiginitomaculum sp.]
MKNSDTLIEDLQKCRQLRSNKERLEKDRNHIIQEVIQLTERVAIRKGEIIFSDTELVRLGNAIRESATGIINNTVGFGVSVARRDPSGMVANPTQLAITLSTTFSRQEEKTKRLRRQRSAEEEKLSFKRKEEAALEARIDTVARQMTARNCAV